MSAFGNEQIEAFLLERGALKVGFATVETLAGGPPSSDLSYVLPGARSAVSFALPLDREKIRRFLAKESHAEHERDNFDTNVRSSRLAKELALRLSEEGFESKRVVSNNVYRTEVDGWQLSMPPDLSHRYVAARSGVGWFGWSGNIGIPGHGTAAILGTVVTAAELEPTEPLPPGDSFCGRCGRCVAACPSRLFSGDEETSVTLGGVTFTFAARRSYMRCQFVCGGFTGLAPGGKWSTWSPGRYTIPQDEQSVTEAFTRAIINYSRWPERSGREEGYVNIALPGETLHLTCGNCQIICWGDHALTRENHRALKRSGCVIQRESGEVAALPHRDAAREFSRMPEAHRSLYQ
ncbi:MAG: epoxyqueuosine reductase [Actinomycetota bacterium]